MNEKYVQALRDVIRDRHKCLARYVETVNVKEEVSGVALEQKVELFDLAGHATARKCYAWGKKDAEGRMKYEAIVGPPVKSAAEAVRGAMGG